MSSRMSLPVVVNEPGALNWNELQTRDVEGAKAFGEAVHKHYLNYGQLEQGLFDKVVTDYERTRMFERG